MPTNLALDDKLIEQAKSVGGHKSKKDAVNAALEEYIQRHRRVEVLKLFGTLDFDESYDYKKERKTRKA